MALNSINTNIAAYYAQQNINKAATNASLSVSRLSSGNRVVRAADDVAALAAGTALRSAVTTLRTALLNASQGSSLLQVADGTLSQIVDILQRQKAIAVQASSGSVSDAQRGFLNQEFQALSSEIDRLASSTNFNGVKLLDGSIFQSNRVTTNTTESTAGSALFFLSSTQFSSDDDITFRIGASTVVFTFTTASGSATQVSVGNNIQRSIDNLVTAINANTSTVLTGYSFTRSGNGLLVTAKTGGSLAAQYGGLSVATNGTTAGLTTTGITVETNYVGLTGAVDNGLGQGSVSVTGTVGDSLVRTLDNEKASTTISFTGNAADDETITIGGVVFTFTDTVASTTNILTGSTLSDSLNNAVQALAAYGQTTTPSDTIKYYYNQLTFRRDGDAIVIEGKLAGDILDGDGTAVSVSDGITNASTSAGNLSSGDVTGVNVNGVINADFIGTISGFEASYVSTDTVNLSITIGEHTYTASSVDTTPTANTPIRFLSAEGGYFDVDLAADQGTAVTLPAHADTFAARLDAAFSTLNFYQDRTVSSYVGVGNILNSAGTTIGTLNGTSFDFRLSDFSSVDVSALSVSAPPTGGTNGSIELTVNGETFRSASTLGTKIAPNATIRLTSTTNTNRFIEFHGPSTTSSNPTAVTAIDFSTADNAAAVEAALKTALGVGVSGRTLDFQVGTSVDDTLAVSIGNATTDELYAGTTISVLSQEAAAEASEIVDTAINNLIAIRANVGALQSRFSFASATIESSIQNQDAARGVLLDTDVATESTAYATAQVQLQAGIAVLAQANLLPQNLLKLIG